MKKALLLACLLFLYLPETSLADRCASSLTSVFTSNQAVASCRAFQSQVSANTASTTNISTFGTISGSTFTKLAEINTKQALTGFSGTENGRGALKLYDTVASPSRSMELGFYQYGGGLFLNSLFEIWSAGVSIRQLSGATPSYLEIRDVNDEENIALRHDSTDGVIYTSGNAAPAGAISLRPTAAETWKFDPKNGTVGGDLTQNASNGGNLVFQRAGYGITVKGGGTAAKAGTFTCNGVTEVVIATTAASANMTLAFSPSSLSGTAPIGSPYVSSITPATNFGVKCSVAGETSVYNWVMITTS